MKRILQIIFILCMVFLVGCSEDVNQDSNLSQPEIGDIIAQASESGITVTEQGIKENKTTEQGVTTTANVEQKKDEGANFINTNEDNTNAGNTENAKDDQKIDKYQTSAVPAGKPDPVEPQSTDIDKKAEYHCTLSITCNTILDNLDKFDQAKLEVLPEDGVIYQTKEVVFYEGENVFDVLLRETRENKVHMEFVSTPIYNSNYIEGINNLYEFDCGELSGWMYKVNDWFPNYGCSRYELQDGDKIEWVYTCDLGTDVGGEWASQHHEEE